jgi:WD40 repeat protein
VSFDARVVASSGGTIKVWDAQTQQLMATMHAHEGGTLRIILSADGRVLASRGGDALLKAWDARTGQLLATLDTHTEPDSAMVISADGRLVGRGCRNGTFELWEVPDGKLVAVIKDAPGLFSAALTADGKLLATGGFGRVRLWDVASEQVRVEHEVGTGPVWSVVLSDDGRLLAHSASSDGADLRDALSGEVLRTFRVERPYERMDITGLTGVTDAQLRALLTLGARQRAT